MLDAMQPQIAQATAACQRMAPEIAQATAAYQRMAPQIQEAARQAVGWYQQHLTELVPVLARIGAEYTALQRSTDKAAVPILKKRHWFGLERYFNPLEFHGLVAAYQKGKGKAADRYVCRKFCQNRFSRLSRVTRDWWHLSYMRKRRPKVRLALKAYRNREYALVIPILLTFADGLAHAYFRANPAKLQVKKGGKTPSVLVPQAASQDAPTRPDYAGLLTAAIVDGLYKSYNFGVDRPPLAVNRHGVLHGDTVGYDTEANALRTILLLDSICKVALSAPVLP